MLFTRVQICENKTELLTEFGGMNLKTIFPRVILEYRDVLEPFSAISVDVLTLFATGLHEVGYLM